MARFTETIVCSNTLGSFVIMYGENIVLVVIRR